MTTETGWDSVTNPGGEAVQGAVLSDTYLAQFKRGWTYTFIYELRDGEGGAGHQGLYQGDRPKPAAIDIHNLTTILADERPLPHPGTLSYVLENPPSTVHDLLLQKSSGEFDLIVWNERARGTDHVAVLFGQVYPQIRLYDVEAGTKEIAAFRSVKQVDLSLSDHPEIIVLPN